MVNVRDYLRPKETADCSKQILFNLDRRDEMLEAFTLYDRDGDGLINTRELGTVFRALGQTPTVCEETDIIAEYALDKCYDLDFIAFVNLMRRRYKVLDEKDELTEAFKRFDKAEFGYILREELRTMLQTLGEPLTPAEVNEWLDDAKGFIDGEKVYYLDFVTFMLSK